MSLLSDTLVFIRHHQDGEIAEKIRNSALGYNMNYGVSSMLLANYAKKTGRNQELAEALWKENFREAKLTTFMVADPTHLSETQINTYVHGCTNIEMVEIAALYLFSHLDEALKYAKQWIRSDERYVKMAGYLTIARLAVLKKFGTADDLNEIFSLYETDLVSHDKLLYQSVTKAFQELAFRRQNLKDAIIAKTNYICERNKGTEFELQIREMIQILKYC